MFEAIASGLIVAAVGGITFIAYKHPKAYKTMELPSQSFKFGVFVVVLMLVWNFGVNETHERLLSSLADGKQEAAKAAIEKLKLSYAYMVWVATMFVGAWLYFVFLWWLPWGLELKDKE